MRSSHETILCTVFAIRVPPPPSPQPPTRTANAFGRFSKFSDRLNPVSGLETDSTMKSVFMFGFMCTKNGPKNPNKNQPIVITSIEKRFQTRLVYERAGHYVVGNVIAHKKNNFFFFKFKWFFYTLFLYFLYAIRNRYKIINRHTTVQRRVRSPIGLLYKCARICKWNTPQIIIMVL